MTDPKTVAAVLAFAPVSGRFTSLYEKSEGVDFTITCKSRSWKVHHFVLSLYSDVLARACDGRFKEANENKIDLSADSEIEIDILVRYMYYFDYTTSPDTDQYSFHVKTIVLADKYNITHLGFLANENLRALLQNSPLQCTPDLVAATKAAYEIPNATQPFLAKLIGTAILDSRKQLKEFSALMRVCPLLAQDVVVNMAGLPVESFPMDIAIRQGDKVQKTCKKCEEERPSVARIHFDTNQSEKVTWADWYCTLCGTLVQCQRIQGVDMGA